jgi:hypothetical protein
MAEKKTRRKNADAVRRKMSPSDEIVAGRRLKLEEGVSREFDMPKEMAEEMSAAFSFQRSCAISLPTKRGKYMTNSAGLLCKRCSSWRIPNIGTAPLK